jgi:glycosyltransferase involved in cell wall biosynthesis
MHICHLLLSPTFGMHQYTADLANRAAAGAFGDLDAHLVTTTSFARDRYHPAVQIHTPVTTRGTGFSREGLRVGGLRRALDEVVGLRPDLVHITGVHVWNAPLVWALRRRGIPVIHTLHDLDPHRGVRHARLIRFWNRLIIAGSDRILVHGQCYRRQLVAAGVPEDKVVYAPLLHLFLGYQSEQSLMRGEPNPLNPFRLQAAESVDCPTALFFGRVEAYKGVETLLAAWTEVAAQLSGSRLIIAGAIAPGMALPPLPPGVELRDRRIGDEEAIGLFRRASLLVLPYQDATQSALVAAAYYFGLPVIVTDTGALPEYVDEGSTGWVAPPGDADALAAALTHALADVGRLRAMGRAGQEWYRAQREIERATLTRLYALRKRLATN